MIAKELDCPVIALSQLSRQVTSRKGGRPMLSDLRESGAIEQDADLVMFLHKPEMPEERPQNVITEVIIAKNRNGVCDTFELIFKGEFCKFVNIAKTDGPTPPPAYRNDEDDQDSKLSTYSKEDLDSLEKSIPNQGDDDAFYD